MEESVKKNLTEERKAELRYYNEILRKCEMKRIGENLTKREVTDIMGVHYNFYWNCINGKNDLSPNLARAIEVYLRMPTQEVYETIFALRLDSQKNKKVKRDSRGKEIPEERLGITKDEMKEYLDSLEKENIFREPKGRTVESYLSQG